MAIKLSYDTCEVFRAATPANAELSNLDVRLACEQVIVEPDSRTKLGKVRKGEILEFVMGEGGLREFRAVSPRHAALSDDDIRAGFDALVKEKNFLQFCNDRWAHVDASPAAPTSVVKK